MDGNKVLEKLSWITQSKLAPQPVTQEYKEQIYRFFANYVHFLQDNGFTTREILRKGEKATDESQITIGDSSFTLLVFLNGLLNMTELKTKIKRLEISLS